MKVVILGSGAEGTGLAGLLVKESEIEQLVLGDYSEAALENTKKNLSLLGDSILGKEIQYRRVDARNIDDVAKVIHGADVAVNAILPKFNIPIMKACIRERVNYCDLLTSPDGPGIPKEETFTAQTELNEEFKKANIIGIPYVGISGGWVSLVVKNAIENFDTLDEVWIYFYEYIDTDEFLAPVIPIVVVSQFIGAPGPLSNKYGELKVVDFIGSGEEYSFPGPAGKRPIYTINSLGDIVLIPDFAGKPIRRVEAKAGVGIGKLETKDILLTALFKASLKQGFERDNINIIEAMADTFLLPNEYSRLLAEGKIRDDYFTMVIEVRGHKESEYLRYISWSITTLEETRKHLPWCGPTVYSTVGGTPVEFVLAMGRGDIDQRGVLRVADVADRQKILDAVARRGHILGEKILRGKP